MKMIEKGRALAVCVLAVGALTAAMASTAQAGEFRAEKYPATIEGKEIEGASFGTVLGIVKCGSITWKGVLAEAGSAVLDMTPTFASCTRGGSGTDVNGNGCQMRYTLGETINGNPDEVEATADWVCPAGKQIEFIDTSTGCVESIPPQNGMGKVTVTNDTTVSPMDVKIDVNITNMHYTLSAACSKPGTYNNGTWASTGTRTAPGSGTGFTIT